MFRNITETQHPPPPKKKQLMEPLQFHSSGKFPAVLRQAGTTSMSNPHLLFRVKLEEVDESLALNENICFHPFYSNSSHNLFYQITRQILKFPLLDQRKAERDNLTLDIRYPALIQQVVTNTMIQNECLHNGFVSLCTSRKDLTLLSTQFITK